MILPILAIAFLAFVLLRPTRARRRMKDWLSVEADKLGAVATVVAALIVLLHGDVWVAFCLFGLSLWMLGRSAGAGHRERAAAFAIQRSSTIELSTDRRTGRRHARVVAGANRGLVLDTLGLEACLAVLAGCRAVDPAGARLLEAYLDGRAPGWRATVEGDQHAGPRRARATGGLTEEQAYQLLGLGRGATRDDVVRAHRTLMKRWHPDQGGSAELAARANEAKEVLLRRHD